jgi:hypothetical protein
MCLQIPGFFFLEEMDVMYNTFEELENGKKLCRSRIKWCGKRTNTYMIRHSLFFA